MITGKNLIDLGFMPEPWFGKALIEANRQNIQVKDLKPFANKFKEAHDKENEDKYIPVHTRPVPYHVNLKIETLADTANARAVHEAMDAIMRTPTVVNGAIMPDACPVGSDTSMPVGSVVVTKNAIHPAMHSADICCSVMMTTLGEVSMLKALDMAQRSTHFGWGGPSNRGHKLPEDLKEQMLSNRFLRNPDTIDAAVKYLGSQGDGNHFLSIGKRKSTNKVVMVTHHGSRGLGSRLYREGLGLAETYRRKLSPETLRKYAWIPYETEDGKQYWEALQIVRAWTKYNHELIHAGTAKLLGVIPSDMIWNEHNFVFKKGSDFYHAKGSTPLTSQFVPDATSDLRLIPLSMKDPILLVKGEASNTNLGFAPHGAGRNLSRTQFIVRNKHIREENLVSKETEDLDVRFYAGHPDVSELPSAYKSAEYIKKQMKLFGLGEVVDEILPYGCIMAGDIHKNASWRYE